MKRTVAIVRLRGKFKPAPEPAQPPAYPESGVLPLDLRVVEKHCAWLFRAMAQALRCDGARSASLHELSDRWIIENPQLLERYHLAAMEMFEKKLKDCGAHIV